MRARLGILLVLVFAACVPAVAGPAAAADLFLAQEPNQEEDVVGNEEEAEGQEGSNQGGREESAEVGADEGETEGASETGPPWTYQMAWLGVLLLVVMIAGVGLAYYRFVVRRQRGLV
jgi:hypothetical protein